MGNVPPSAASAPQHQHHVTFSPTVGEIAPPAGQNDGEASEEAENRVSVKFVQDSSRFWYKPGITREQGRSDVLFPNFNEKSFAMITLFFVENCSTHNSLWLCFCCSNRSSEGERARDLPDQGQ